MSSLYLPEGRLLHTPENQALCATLASLRTAWVQETILEGRAILSSPDRDLTVAVGPFLGTIPREDTALGIREGTTREIAVLSRVGKPVSFTVKGVEASDGTLTLQLSRRRAQEKALAKLLDTPPGTILPATVTHLETFGAFVDIGCGVVSMVGIENCSVSRISHPSCRFTVGQRILVVLTGADPDLGRVYLSHKELLGTWAENAAKFTPGMTVPGVVRGVKEYGAFVELAPNFTGLADRVQGLEENDRVSVYIRSIQPDRMKVKLTVIHKLDPCPKPEPLSYFITRGRVDRWEYSPPGCRREKIVTAFS